MITDQAAAYSRVLDELLPAACHVMERYANNPIESDHGRLKARLTPMRGLKRLCSARVISAGHASFKTSGAATTNSASMLTRSDSFRRPSPNSPLPSDHDSTQTCHTRIPSTQQRPLIRVLCFRSIGRRTCSSPAFVRLITGGLAPLPRRAATAVNLDVSAADLEVRGFSRVDGIDVTAARVSSSQLVQKLDGGV